MSKVKRVYVEKQSAYAVKAKELNEEIRSYLGIKTVTKVRVLVRYDVENISEDTYKRALKTVFAELPVDIVMKRNSLMKRMTEYSVSNICRDSLIRERILQFSV